LCLKAVLLTFIQLQHTGEQGGGWNLDLKRTIGYGMDVPDESQLRDILTDVDGIPHNNTFHWKLRDEVWKRQLEIGQKLLPGLLSISLRIPSNRCLLYHDTLSTKAAFFDGNYYSSGWSFPLPAHVVQHKSGRLHCELLEKVSKEYERISWNGGTRYLPRQDV